MTDGSASNGHLDRHEVKRFGLSNSAFVLNEDPDLVQALSPGDRIEATQRFRAAVICLPEGDWDPPELDADTTYGLLMLDGLLGRRTIVGRGLVTELLGPGDIVRPWIRQCPWSFVPARLEWRVCQPTRLALLDERITRLIGERPELVVAFSDRLLSQVQSAQYLMAVCSLPRADDRVIATLWHLASKWGTVTPNGVSIPFRLKHQLLAQIIGARRPSVTMALRDLRRRGEVKVGPGGRYLLTGDPSDWESAHAAIRREPVSTQVTA